MGRGEVLLRPLPQRTQTHRQGRRGGRRMSTVLFWFRNDLRLHDQPALRSALTSGATHLLPVVCLPAPDESTPWGFARVGTHRRAFTAESERLISVALRHGRPLSLMVIDADHFKKVNDVFGHPTGDAVLK
eukprot:gene18940-26813_t